MSLADSIHNNPRKPFRHLNAHGSIIIETLITLSILLLVIAGLLKNHATVVKLTAILRNPESSDCTEIVCSPKDSSLHCSCGHQTFVLLP